MRRRGARSQRPGADWRFEAGDVVVLLGRPGTSIAAEQRLLRGLKGRSVQRRASTPNPR